MDPEVVEAMAEAAQTHLAIDELQERAGALIAQLTGAEAGYVTSGASAGLALGTAACVAGCDVARMDSLPDTTGMPNEVVVQRGHRNAYDHAIRMAGIRLVEVGYLGVAGTGRTYGWQIENAINERTAAVACPIQFSPGSLPLPEVAEIAHRRCVPVIVDAAGALPPVENLRRFIAEGADLVAFSGGKAIAGPQGSGILCGRADLIRSVALQNQDMDVQPSTWRYRKMVEEGKLPGPPHHGIGRPMKVGKETIVGLLVALQRFASHDHEAELHRQETLLSTIADYSRPAPGVITTVESAYETDRPHPTLFLDFGRPQAVERASAVARALRDEEPPIYVGEAYLHTGRIAIVASTLREEEAELVGRRLHSLLVKHRGRDSAATRPIPASPQAHLVEAGPPAVDVSRTSPRGGPRRQR